MINVELKAKHYFLIAELLFASAAYESFNTLSSIKTACEGSADDDLVTLDIAAGDVIKVYNILTYKPEGQFNRINTEMFDMLAPQIQAGMTAGDEEWIYLGTSLEATRQSNLGVADSLVASGKSKLYP
jgi:hypothetical protein